VKINLWIQGARLPENSRDDRHSFDQRVYDRASTQVSVNLLFVKK